MAFSTIRLLFGMISLLLLLCNTVVAAFVVTATASSSRSTQSNLSIMIASGARASRPSTQSLMQDQASSSTSHDILKPPYEIEPIPIRIGHGFDIHRMAPIEEAGQPIVIGGVVIPHSNQKVRFETGTIG